MIVLARPVGRLCRRRRLLVYAHRTHATRKSVPFHQVAAEHMMAADNKRSTFPFFPRAALRASKEEHSSCTSVYLPLKQSL